MGSMPTTIISTCRKGNRARSINPVKGIARGTVTRHAVPTRDYAAGALRNVYLYHPPVETPVPLLFVYDGYDYLHRARLNVILDNLIAEKRIRPIALAMVQNGGAARTIEYSCSESTLGFLMECVLPLAKGLSELGTGKKWELWGHGLFIGRFDGAFHSLAAAPDLSKGAQPVGSLHCARLPVRGGGIGALCSSP